MDFDDDRLWRAIEAGDPRFDGWVYCGVTSTGIYCRPSCPARTPKRQNVRFYPSAAAAQGAGFRACKRCRPDATPGSPEWDRRNDLVGRAMRLIADGVVDREGVRGLAARLGYTDRHLHRELVAVAGAGPLALARAQRAQTARILLETTDVTIADVAFASGFQSVRQFNDTIREVFAETPTSLRRKAGRRRPDAEHGSVVLRLPYRTPFDFDALLAFLGPRSVPGVEEVGDDGAYRRSLRLPRAAGVVELRAGDGAVQARLWLDDLRDLATAVQRCRVLCDLDADPASVVDALGRDRTIGRFVRAAPGRRVPGHVDGDELAVRAVLGQQVTVAGATTLAGRLVAAHGEPLAHPLGGLTHLFPSADVLADPATDLPSLPERRRQTLRQLTAALARGDLPLDGGADRDETLARLEALPGIGPWTAGYVAMRVLRDPDAFLATDLGVRRSLVGLGCDGRPAAVVRLAEAWRPYRAYALQHLWARLIPSAPSTPAQPTPQPVAKARRLRRGSATGSGVIKESA
jgi:AraC family transcriptional regulator of adaptative response / DNA-3-methyladenine glycosylase II